MKASIYKNYGEPEVLHIAEVQTPIIKDNQILIRNFATAVNSGDWRLRKPNPFAVRLAFGLFKPKNQILGGVFSGVVEKIGNKITKFKIGDRVFGMTKMVMGCYAEYISVDENFPIGIIPEKISYLDAASVPFGATTAYHFLQKANIQKGQTILIYGASGSVGTAAVQLAKYFGAIVTSVSSSANMEMLKSIGADFQLDYTKENFFSNTEKYDFVFEAVGKLSFKQSLNFLKPNGTLILNDAGIVEFIKSAIKNIIGKQKVLFGLALETPEQILFIQNLMAQNKIKPVIDKVYKIENMSDAHRYVESGHKKGNVVVEI